MTENRDLPSPFADSSAPMTPDDQRNDGPAVRPFPGLPVRTPTDVAGQDTSQDQPFGRPSQDQLAEGSFATPANDTDDDDYNENDYEFVRIGGQVRAIRKSSVSDEPETATQNIPKSAMAEVVDPHFYVWLADGNVIRVKQSDLPVAAGTNAAFGHWQIEDKVFQIVNVYPVEDIVKGDK
jgi:hypothetical protein